MSIQDGLMARRKLWYLFALMMACYLAFSTCGTSRRADATLVEAITPSESLPSPEDSIPIDVYPELIYEEPVDFPELARILRYGGLVEISALVDTQGVVQEVKVWKSSGSEFLDEAALASAWKNRFTPAMSRGKPVAVWVRYRVDFEQNLSSEDHHAPKK